MIRSFRIDPEEIPCGGDISLFFKRHHDEFNAIVEDIYEEIVNGECSSYIVSEVYNLIFEDKGHLNSTLKVYLYQDRQMFVWYYPVDDGKISFTEGILQLGTNYDRAGRAAEQKFTMALRDRFQAFVKVWAEMQPQEKLDQIAMVYTMETEL